MLKNKSPDEKPADTLLAKSQIPIIDLAHCGTEETPIKSVVCRVGSQLSKALAEKGMAFLVNHGISQDKLKLGFHFMDEFCKLSDESKEVFVRKSGNNHGYVKPGQEKFDNKTRELRHSFNICNLDPSTLPEESVPGFQEHMTELVRDFRNLSGLILQSLAMSLEMPTHFFADKHLHMLEGTDENETTFRLLYYPPFIEEDEHIEQMKGSYWYSVQRCTRDELDLRIPDYKPRNKEEEEELNLTRCGAHCDYGTFTLLVQDSEGGLEVKQPGSNTWKRVGFLPGAILVNAGELLAVWTQDKYPALLHRVVIPEQSSIRSRGRHSIAFFVHPDNETEIIPIAMPSSSSCDDMSSSSSSCEKKPKNRSRSFKAAKTKIYNAYQHVQRRFKETYAS